MVLCAQHRIFTKGSVLHPITPYTARHRVGNMAQTWHCMHCSAADARQCRFTSGIKWVGFKSFSLLLKTGKGQQRQLLRVKEWLQTGFASEQVAEEAGAGEVHSGSPMGFPWFSGCEVTTVPGRGGRGSRISGGMDG